MDIYGYIYIYMGVCVYGYIWICMNMYRYYNGLNMLGPGSGNIWKCGLVGVCVSLWEWAFTLYS